MRPLTPLAALACGFALSPAFAARPVVPDDALCTYTVTEPAISPDGDWVAYTVTGANPRLDRDESNVWLVPTRGGEPRPLTRRPGGGHSPRWSPDGRWLAFLSDRADEKAGDQVWLLDRRGGEPQQLTQHRGEVSAFDWSPDGRRLVYSAVDGPEPAPADRPRPIVVDRFQFKEDRKGYLGTERAHLWLQGVAGGDAVALTSGRFNEENPAWSPDGGLVAFYTKRGADPDRTQNQDVWAVEPRAGAEPRQLTTNPGFDGDPAGDWGDRPPSFSPDGARVAYTHGAPPEQLWYGIWQAGIVPSAGGAATLPTAGLDRQTVAPRWTPDGKSLWLLLEDDRAFQLARVRLRDGRVERVTPADRVVSAYDVARDGRVVVVASAPDRPDELYALERGALRPLTHHNDAWVAGVTLVPARDTAFRSADGTEVHGLLMTPATPRPAAGYPAILWLHGGPQWQHQREFDVIKQLYASHGYAVILPNPRGSTGRGERFGMMHFGRWGEGEVDDVLAAVDAAVRDGVADPGRLGVGGWSWGGVLTDYVIARDGRFRAAMSGAGEANMLGVYGVDQYVRDYELELGTPWRNTDAWLRVSAPFFHADGIHAPTLFVVGQADFNVPAAGSEQMYQALRSLGVPTELVIYPEQFHHFNRASYRVDRLQRFLAWYDRFLGAP